MDDPQNDDSFARTLGSDEELRYPSRHSSRANGQMIDTPTDESTIPHKKSLPSTRLNKGSLPSTRQHLYQSTPISEHPSSRSLTTNRSLHSNRSLPSTRSHAYHSTPISELPLNVRDSRELVDQLQQAIGILETQMYVMRDYVREKIRALNEKYKAKERDLEIAIDLLSDESQRINDEKAELSKLLANTRVELRSTKDQVKKLSNQISTDSQDMSQKFKALNEERTRDKSELSGLKVRFNDQKRFNAEQQRKIEDLEAQNRKLRETNNRVMSSATRLRLQIQGLQQSLNEASSPLNTQQLQYQDSQQPSNAASSINRLQRQSSQKQSNAAPSSSARRSRPASSLRFSNRTQVRDISPIELSSMIEQSQEETPQEVASEIHTASCRYNCHLFEHEGDEGRFRWICGMNERLIVMYREERYVVFIPEIAEIQFFGEGQNQGQLIVFWTTKDEDNKEITVYRKDGTREEYRMNAENEIFFREVFHSDGSALRITQEGEIQIEPEDETPLEAGVETTLNGPNDIQITHREFALRLVNHEFMRIQVMEECLQITMCLCEGRRIFNTKHCSNDFQQKSLCTFIGTCPNMPIH